MQPKDINGQLQWLTNTLHEAELNNERVHILSHIPARGSLYVYTREYKRIVERSVITFLFYLYKKTSKYINVRRMAKFLFFKMMHEII